MKKNKRAKIYFVYSNSSKKAFTMSCYTIKEIAEILDRDVKSIYTAMARLRKKKKNIVLKSKTGEKYEIISDKDLQRG